MVNELIKLVDLLIMTASFVLALWVAGDYPPLRQLAHDYLRATSIPKALGLLIFWHFSLHFLGLYGSRRLLSRWREAFDILRAMMLVGLLTNLTGYIIDANIKPYLLFSVFCVVSTLLILAARLLQRALLEWARKRGRNLRNVLMVGTNKRARRFANLIESKAALGFRIMGYVDEDWHGLEQAMEELGIDELATSIDKLDEYLRENPVDEVIIALPFSTSYRESSRIVSLCEEQGIMVRFVSQFFDTRLAKAQVEMFQGVPVLSLMPRVMDGWQSVIKRVMDLTVSTVLLILLMPVFIVVSIAIKVTSPGPVFFVQRRLGLNKRTFPLLKFRTMVVNAEQILDDIAHLNEVSGPVFKIKEDPRITAIGHFLRSTSIDELPQLWNVFTGAMSLVGPRPLPLRDVEGFDRDQDRYRRRFSVRPGITCLWQVGGRSSIPFEEWMELDLQYIDEWSLWLDFKILLQTIPVVFRPLVFGHPGEFQTPSKPLAEVLKFKDRTPPDTGTVSTIKNTRGLT